jgi:hypothetical protein
MNPTVPHIVAAPIATTGHSACASAADFISEKPESQRFATHHWQAPNPAKAWRLWTARMPQPHGDQTITTQRGRGQPLFLDEAGPCGAAL